jgi:hypothetical protein
MDLCRRSTYNNEIQGYITMIASLTVLVTAAVMNFSQPLLDQSMRWLSGNESVASSCQCPCCKGGPCTCGMEKPKASAPKTKKDTENGEPCCGNTFPAPQSENSAIVPFNYFSLNEFQQSATVSTVAMDALPPKNGVTNYRIHSSSSPPGYSFHLPLRV